MPLKPKTANRKDLRTGISPMQHRHFCTIAAIVRGLGTEHTWTQENLARYFAAELAATNPRFDRERFLAACGVS